MVACGILLQYWNLAWNHNDSSNTSVDKADPQGSTTPWKHRKPKEKERLLSQVTACRGGVCNTATNLRQDSKAVLPFEIILLPNSSKWEGPDESQTWSLALWHPLLHKFSFESVWALPLQMRLTSPYVRGGSIVKGNQQIAGFAINLRY